MPAASFGRPALIVFLLLTAPRVAVAQPATPAPQTVASPPPVANTTAHAPDPAPQERATPAAAPAETWRPAPIPVSPTPPVASQPQPNVQVQQVQAQPPAPDLWQERRRQIASERRRAKAAIITGWTLLGVGWATSAFTGALAIDLSRPHEDWHRVRWGQAMMIPLGGPFIAATQSRLATGALLTASLGAIQVAGFVTAIVGHTRMRRWKRAHGVYLSAAPTAEGGLVSVGGRF